MSSELLDRQRQMYSRPDLRLADKWPEATDFYRADLESGHVRSLQELVAHSWSSPRVAERVRVLVGAWIEVLVDVAADARAPRHPDIEPADVAAMVGGCWFGMEELHLLDIPEHRLPFWHATGSIAELIERLERGSARRGRSP